MIQNYIKMCEKYLFPDQYYGMNNLINFIVDQIFKSII